MSKIYAFLLIIPLMAILYLKAISFYEFDTKQRYIKNAVDSTAHKVMITGVMTDTDKEELLYKLRKLGKFKDTDLVLECGCMEQDGTWSELCSYSLGSVLERGEVFRIYVQSEAESRFSKIEAGSDYGNKLFYKAKAVCRVEKNQQKN
ncbi:hypothetical protein LY28_00963 [Ruminiclostridium sufflavum DSM 19573]|uniref:Uncharacterized protein n=1 Tax=Ruminiclostridium sufflavum DSM 19573 TaxID=1121337 RepID=A0A318XPM9_9FIRM|nr:hypothetical protein [Ruminiclostridium sufflavum]PYG89140.1 hypothetical protein LY28_00963 [Ruminiclostridium sufflavum DSM 19573]